MHVGDHQHRRRMLEEPVRHLLEAEAHVLDRDLLAHDVERHRREAPVHLPHDPGEHRAVAHACVEHPERRRPRVDVPELQPRALRHRPLLAAGVDEHQVLLAVVVEAEGAPLVVSRRLGWPAGRGARRGAVLRRRRRVAIREELPHPRERRRAHLPPVAQAADEAPVAQRLAAEGGGRHALALAEVLDRREELLPLVHDAAWSRRCSRRVTPAPGAGQACGRRRFCV